MKHSKYLCLLLSFLAPLTAVAAPFWVKIGGGTPPSCSSGYIPVKAFTLPNNVHVPAFCIMKYEAKKHNNTLTDRSIGGTAGTYPVSTPEGSPWRKLTWQDARSACATTGAHLTSENQWLSIAHQVISITSNWTGGARGVGFVYMGHTDGTPGVELPASALDTEGYSGTGNGSGEQRRTLTLPGGQIIWDFSGNASEYVDEIIALANGYHPGAGRWYSYGGVDTFDGSPPIATNMPLEKRPPSGFNVNQGMGRYYAGEKNGLRAANNTYEAPDLCSGNCGPNFAFIRGGGWADRADAGIFSLMHFHGLTSTALWAQTTAPGFRCTK